jgi:hypothetical protein
MLLFACMIVQNMIVLSQMLLTISQSIVNQSIVNQNAPPYNISYFPSYNANIQFKAPVLTLRANALLK